MNLHRTTHRLSKRLPHRTTRGPRLKEPNQFPRIITALRRTIKLHRRLMKIAPIMFDYGLRNHLELQLAEQEKWNRQVEIMLRKVYGPADPDPPPKTGPTDCWDFMALKLRDPWNSLSPAKQERVKKLYTEWELWMTIAREARTQLDQQRRPHRPGFGTIASLLDIAFTLKRLASGLETNFKPPATETFPSQNWAY